jgi:RNA polymerase sigma-70 factor (ECF subfamily)
MRVATGPNNIPDGNSDPSGASSISSSLLRGLQAYDPEAWRRMAMLYTPWIYSRARHSGLQRDDAADVVQEVFRAVLARVVDFSKEGPNSTFRGWLWRITYHKLGDFFRQQRSHPQGQGGSDALEKIHDVTALSDSSSAEAIDDLNGLCHRGLSLVRVEFRETTWQAFWQVVVEDQAPEKVAESLGMTMNAVYLAKSRILRRLREVLGDQDV